MYESPQAPRQTLLERWSSMKQVREPRLQHWRDITTFLLPWTGRYLQTPTQRDRNVHPYQDIIDETGTNAIEVLESGMMALRTSPARPWFRYQARDPEINKLLPVKQWFREVEDVSRLIHRVSNTNLALSHIYSEMAAFGTAATIMVEDDDRFMHHHILTVGEYAIASDARGHVDSLYREFSMSVSEVVREFGYDKCSPTVKTLADDHRWEALVPIIHAIEPRSLADREWGNPTAKHMPWMSVYFEVDAGPNFTLREGGHDRFPCIVPRWRLTGGDVWGEGPGTKALGSVRELQVAQIRKAEVIDHLSAPPVQVPASLRDQDRDLLPKGVIPYDQNSPNGGVRAAFEIQGSVRDLLDSIEDVRRRIERSFYTNLFQPVTALSDTTQRTAMEIAQRREEMLTILGPVTTRSNTELDEPLIRFTFETVIRRNMVRPPPPELLGQDVDVEFIGPLAQALKQIDAQTIDRGIIHLGQLAALKPEVLDRYDFDKDLEVYADMMGIDPSLIVGGRQVAMIRKARADVQAAAAQSQAMVTQASTAKDLSAADMGGNNALTSALSSTTGYQ